MRPPGRPAGRRSGRPAAGRAPGAAPGRRRGPCPAGVAGGRRRDRARRGRCAARRPAPPRARPPSTAAGGPGRPRRRPRCRPRPPSRSASAGLPRAGDLARPRSASQLAHPAARLCQLRAQTLRLGHGAAPRRRRLQSRASRSRPSSRSTAASSSARRPRSWTASWSLTAAATQPGPARRTHQVRGRSHVDRVGRRRRAAGLERGDQVRCLLAQPRAHPLPEDRVGLERRGQRRPARPGPAGRGEPRPPGAAEPGPRRPASGPARPRPARPPAGVPRPVSDTGSPAASGATGSPAADLRRRSRRGSVTPSRRLHRARHELDGAVDVAPAAADLLDRLGDDVGLRHRGLAGQVEVPVLDRAAGAVHVEAGQVAAPRAAPPGVRTRQRATGHGGTDIPTSGFSTTGPG